MEGKARRYIAGGASLAIVIAILFLPLMTMADVVSETYSEIETILEPYSATEPYTVEVVDRQSRIIYDGYYEIAPVGNYGTVYGDNYVASGVAYLGTVKTPVFTIAGPDVRIIGLFENPVTGTFTIIDAENNTIFIASGDI